MNANDAVHTVAKNNHVPIIRHTGIDGFKVTADLRARFAQSEWTMHTRFRNRCLRKTIVTNPDRLKLERADPLRSIRCVHGALQYTRLRRDGPLASVRVVQREFRVLRVQIVDAVASVTSA